MDDASTQSDSDADIAVTTNPVGTDATRDARADEDTYSKDALVGIGDDDQAKNNEHADDVDDSQADKDDDERNADTRNGSRIVSGWHLPVRAEWQDAEGNACSLADLALNVTYDASRKTAFLKVRTRIDLRRTKNFRQYLHWPPEHVQRLLLVNSSSTSAVPDLDLSAEEEQPNTNTQLLNPALRYLHFETRRAATLIVPRYPCEAKSVHWGRKLQLFQLLGRALSFTLAVSIPLRTIPDAVLRALAEAFARQDLAADAEEACYQRYYRGRAVAVDLAAPNPAGIPSVAELASYRHQDDKAPDPRPAVDAGTPSESGDSTVPMSSPPGYKRVTQRGDPIPPSNEDHDEVDDAAASAVTPPPYVPEEADLTATADRSGAYTYVLRSFDVTDGLLCPVGRLGEKRPLDGQGFTDRDYRRRLGKGPRLASNSPPSPGPDNDEMVLAQASTLGMFSARVFSRLSLVNTVQGSARVAAIPTHALP